MKMKKYLKPFAKVSDVEISEVVATEGFSTSNWLQMPDEWNNLEGDPEFD